MDFSMDNPYAAPASSTQPHQTHPNFNGNPNFASSSFSAYNAQAQSVMPDTPLLTPNTMQAMGMNAKRKRGFEGEEEVEEGMIEGVGVEEANKQPRFKSPEAPQNSTFPASSSDNSMSLDENGFINGGGRQNGYMITDEGMGGANAGFASGREAGSGGASNGSMGNAQYDYFAQHPHQHRSAPRRPSTIDTPLSDMSMANTPYEAPIDSPWYPAGGGAVPLATPGLSAALAQSGNSAAYQNGGINGSAMGNNGYVEHSALPEDFSNGLPFQTSALSAQPFSSTLGAPPMRIGLMQPGMQRALQPGGAADGSQGHEGMQVEGVEGDLAGMVEAARNVHG